jgi:hypothetical protein
MSVLTEFQDGLLDPDHDVPAGLQDGAGRPAGRRYSVYRNNVTLSLIEALEAGFPLLRKLIGGQRFAAMAPLFVRAHPPRSPLMMFYGQSLPEFLKDYDPLRQIGYLPDAARLDLAMRSAYHAADAQMLDPAWLAAKGPDDLARLTLSLLPSARILRSRWPLFDIWRYAMTEGAPKPQAAPQEILITRPEFDPEPHLLPPGVADFLEALQAGRDLSAAQLRTTATHPEFDLGAALAVALNASAFAHPSQKDQL